MKKSIVRTPKNYCGTEVTTYSIKDLSSSVLSKLHSVYQEQPELILSAWGRLIGPKLASMTEAVSFIDGVLTVKVKNATLHSLLSRHDKPRLLIELRRQFPRVYIANIAFRIA